MNKIKLKPWQAEVISIIDDHARERESEAYQGMSDYDINRNLGISIALPRKSGHTFLANYIASKYACVLVHGDMKNFNTVTATFPLHAGTDCLSMFEIFYAMNKPSLHQPTQDLVDLNSRFDGKKVVVADNGIRIPDEIRNYLYSVSQGIVVLLGH